MYSGAEDQHFVPGQSHFRRNAQKYLAMLIFEAVLLIVLFWMRHDFNTNLETEMGKIASRMSLTVDDEHLVPSLQYAFRQLSEGLGGYAWSLVFAVSQILMGFIFVLVSLEAWGKSSGEQVYETWLRAQGGERNVPTSKRRDG